MEGCPNRRERYSSSNLQYDNRDDLPPNQPLKSPDPSPHNRSLFPDLAIMERIPAKRTTARVAAFEPSKETTAVEHVSTGAAPFAGELPVGPDHAVADGALSLALERGRHVAPPRQQTVDQRALVPAAAEVDHPLRRHQPAVPFLLVDGNAVHRVDRGARERVRGREPDDDLHVLLVDGNASCDLARRRRDFDGEWLVGGGLRGCPFADGAEL